MNRDFVEMLSALSDAGAEYLVVGAHALAAHGYVRATGDLDLWVRPKPTNAQRVWLALQTFGAPLHSLNESELSQPDLIFQIGVPPQRIDILTSITGVEFEEAWNSRIEVMIEGRSVPVIGRSDLIANKRASGRPRDLADVDELTRVRESTD
ncbi:MAG: nucleotidyltransferase [Gemmatimonadota bacterium]